MSQTTLPEGFRSNFRLHAYLVLSSDYEARNRMARAIAKSMLCTGKKENDAEPCCSCSHCIKMDAGTHPDCIFVGKGAKTKVDDVRDISDEAYLAPNEGDIKVFVLENADEFNVQSQNALLKIIEEPPENVRFVLTGASAGAVLPTVRSRVCTLTGEVPLPDVIISQIKKERPSLSEEDLNCVAAFLQSYDKTDIKELDEKLLQKYKDLAVSYFSGQDTCPVLKFPSKREELMLCLQVFMLVAGELCRARGAKKHGISFLTEGEMSACIRRTSLKKAHGVYDVLEEGYLLTESYANANAVLGYLMQSIR